MSRLCDYRTDEIYYISIIIFMVNIGTIVNMCFTSLKIMNPGRMINI